MKRFFRDNPDIVTQIGKYYPVGNLNVKSFGSNNIVYHDGQVVASHIVVHPDYTPPKRDKSKNKPFNHAELMQKGHMIAHQFGGTLGDNIFVQLYESNEYQRITAESYVRQLLNNSESVEVLAIPLYRHNGRVDKLVYLYRSEGTREWSQCDIPNTIDELKQVRHRAYFERKQGYDSLSDSFSHVNRYYREKSNEMERS